MSQCQILLVMAPDNCRPVEDWLRDRQISVHTVSTRAEAAAFLEREASVTMILADPVVVDSNWCGISVMVHEKGLPLGVLVRAGSKSNAWRSVVWRGGYCALEAPHRQADLESFIRPQ